jgi:nitrous-oxide reductase
MTKEHGRRGLPAMLSLSLLALVGGCFKENERGEKPRAMEASPKSSVAELASGDLDSLASRRGLSDADLLAAAKTYTPTGAHDPVMGFFGTGTGGSLAVIGMPSMRILKFVGVFTPEPWQGYAYDDESKTVLDSSAREDIHYEFGDLGRPALSLTRGAYDGASTFVVDAANARVAVVALDDFETKQVVVNPLFRGSAPFLAVTASTEYVVQTSAAPEIPGGAFAAPDAADTSTKLRGGATFWHVKRSSASDTGHDQHDALDVDGSYTVELPPYLQGQVIAGKGATADWVFILGLCRAKTSALDDASPCASGKAPAVLHAINWETAAKPGNGISKVQGHQIWSLDAAARGGILRQLALPIGASGIALSPDGSTALVTFQTGTKIALVDLGKLIQAEAAKAEPDDFGVPTYAFETAKKSEIEIGGPSSAGAYAAGGVAYVAALAPGRLLRIDPTKATVTSTLNLTFDPVGLLVPGTETTAPSGTYAVVFNNRPHGRFVDVGPVTGLNPQLIDVSAETMHSIYDMSVPLATALSGVALPADVLHPINRYKAGTNSRTDKMSPLRTMAGQEKIIRDGNRVHVLATVIRSHITPDLVEVNEGDIVSFHITNLEQAEDQTHGFTVDTYNVHGSWEPGKTASVTLVANRSGVFPYYCTEFCSALHLEMEGYLLVKPKGWKPTKEDLAKATPASPEADKRAYEAKLKGIQDTQATIDAVVTWLKDHDFAKNPSAAELLKDATDQLDQAKALQPKIDAAAKSGDWQGARLWAEQFFQYQVKAADAGLRAKKVISEAGGQK